MPNPENPNSHPQEQIERLAKVIAYQGQRSPIVVSNRSGLITKGHGRLLALKFLGWKQSAVDYQDYDSDEQEYADVVADNALAAWSELNLSSINSVMLDMGPDFDIELLGVKDFVVEPADKISNLKVTPNDEMFNAFLDSDTRYFQFIYNLNDYETVQSLMKKVQEEFKQENFSMALLSLLKSIYEEN